MRTAIDTNVLSSILEQEPTSADWVATLNNARLAGPLVVCGAVFAELSACPKIDVSRVRRFLDSTDVAIDFALHERVWVLTAERYATYAGRRRRSSHGQPKRMLADFLIGAHAVLLADRLCTQDRDRYRRDFPELKLL